MPADPRPGGGLPITNVPRAAPKRVVIVGAGFVEIAAARSLRRSDAEVVLIDRRNHHMFQPLLHQVTTVVLAPFEIAAPIPQLEARQPNLSVPLGEVRGVNVHSWTIDACCPGLVIATGMRPSYFGHDELAIYVPGLKSLSDAEAIRATILGAFELAESTDDLKERARQTAFVLVGAGATGVELAASTAHMVRVTPTRISAN
jgi:NADH dehydrogenase